MSRSDTSSIHWKLRGGDGTSFIWFSTLLIIVLRARRSGYRSSIPGRGERIFPVASVSIPALGPTRGPPS
jgi:hypothetical protein